MESKYGNTIQFNLVPKIEPSSGENDLSSEFVGKVLPTEPTSNFDCRGTLAGRMKVETPYMLKELRVLVRDCVKDTLILKKDVSDEPEVKLEKSEEDYDDFFENQRTEKPSVNEEPAEKFVKSEEEVDDFLENQRPEKQSVNEEPTEKLVKSGEEVDDFLENQRTEKPSVNEEPAEKFLNSEEEDDDFFENQRTEDPSENESCTSQSHASPQRKENETTLTLTPQNSTTLLPNEKVSTKRKKKERLSYYNEETSTSDHTSDHDESYKPHKASKSFLTCRKISTLRKRTLDKGETEPAKIHMDKQVETSTSDHSSDYDESYNPHKAFKSFLTKRKSSTSRKRKLDKGKTEPAKINMDKQVETGTSESNHDEICNPPEVVEGFPSRRNASTFRKKTLNRDKEESAEKSTENKEVEYNIAQDQQECVSAVNGSLCQCIKCKNKYDTKTLNMECISSAKDKSCPICNRGFIYNFKLKRHLKTHDNVKPFSCDICGRAFLEKYTLVKHKLKVHIKDTRRKYNIAQDQQECMSAENGILCQCFKCKTGYDTKTHNMESASSAERVSCAICKRRYIRKKDLSRHLKTHVELNLFPCHICDRAYTLKYSLLQHKRKEHSLIPQERKKLHSRIKRIFKCELCDKIYQRKDILYSHNKRVHEKKKPFQCADCGQTFYSKYHLTYHVQSRHLPKEESYICEVCGHGFLSKPGLSQHLKKHSAATPEYSCEICGLMFKTNFLLFKHKSVHSDNTPYMCQTCGKTFKRDHNLQQHQHTHSDNRPHACHICGKTFKLRTHVKQHMAVHGEIKNFKCDLCEKAFARQSQLNSHLATHGP